MTKPVILFAWSTTADAASPRKFSPSTTAATASTCGPPAASPVEVSTPSSCRSSKNGLSVNREAPKLLTYVGVQEADFVITMGCGETCPVFPGKTYEDWQLADPKGQDRATVQRIVAENDEQVQDLLTRVPV